MRRELLTACALMVVACSEAPGPDRGGWQATRETVGDITVVRTISGSVWDAPREAVVELQIGSLEGPEETMFGRVRAIAPDRAGGVYVYDLQVPAIRYFDASGQFVRQVGGEGQGPGEYLDAVLAMAVRADDRLQIWDARNRRVTIYTPDGEYSQEWRIDSGLFTGEAMFLDAADHTYIKFLQEQPVEGEPWKIGLLHFDAGGNGLDAIPDPPVDAAPSDGAFLSPSKQWTFTRDGSLVVGMNDAYGFEIRGPDGRAVRVERDIEPLALTDAEFEAYEERRQYMIRTQGQFMTQLPGETSRIKPAYRSLYADPAGRVWVQIYSPVEPAPDYEPAPEGEMPAWPFVEPKVFDVFEPDGSYLGQVHVPSEVTIHVFDLETSWGVMEGDLDQHYVVRMRLQPRS